MRVFKIGLAALLAMVAAFVGCGQNQANGSSSTGAGGAHCANVFIGDFDGFRCNECLHHYCCAELVDCAATDYCEACLVVGGFTTEPPCNMVVNAPAYNAMAWCTYNHCECECSGHSSQCDGGVDGAAGDGGGASSSSGP